MLHLTYHIIVLICAANIEHAACTRETALDAFRPQPRTVITAQQCAFVGLTTLASTALVPDPARQYAKVVCSRDPVHRERGFNGTIVSSLE